MKEQSICKDCIFDGVCRFVFDGYLLASYEYCRHFKNKADFAEVKHGYWDDTKCSVCGKLNPTLYMDEWELEFRAKETPYCANCGAKMDGTREEAEKAIAERSERQ